MLELAATIRVCISVAAPELMPERPTVCGGPSWLRTRSAIGSSVGGWFPALTVSTKVSLTGVVPSLTVKVIVANQRQRFANLIHEVFRIDLFGDRCRQ